MPLQSKKNQSVSGNRHNIRSLTGKFVSASDLLNDKKTINTVGQLQQAIQEVATSIYNQEGKYSPTDVLALQRIAKIFLDVDEHRESIRLLKK